jgi:hypothetical protein
MYQIASEALPWPFNLLQSKYLLYLIDDFRWMIPGLEVIDLDGPSNNVF